MKKSSLKRLFVPLAAAMLSLVIIFASACAPSCGLYFSTMDWAVAMIDAYYYYDVSEDDVRSAGLENLTGNVLDIYSGYYTAEEYAALQSSNEGNRSGVGIGYYMLSSSSEEVGGSGVYIDTVFGNSPAERSGLRPGTFVIGAETADGTETAIESTDDLSAFVGARGAGENFTLITNKGRYEMAKQDYIMSYCHMATSSEEWTISYSASGTMSIDSDESDRYSYLPEGAAYISLSQFYGNAAKEMAELIRIFNDTGCTSLIFDLRNNGGGYVSVMQSLTHLFTADLENSSDIAMYAQFKDGSRLNYDVDKFTSDSQCYLPAGTQVTVLANNGTASASEALIGALISNGVIGYDDVWVSQFSDEYIAATGLAEDFNSRTYGKGIMQSTFVYAFTGEALKLTVAGIFWPNGTTIHGKGLTVDDGCHAVQAEWNVTYGDEELGRVIAAVYAG